MSEGVVPAALSVSDDSGSALITPEHLTGLESLTAFLYRRLHLGGAVELAITLVDDETMAGLHEQWMELPGTTDVMSFPMDQLRPGTAPEPVTTGVLGDVVISPAVAAEQAEAIAHPLEDELALLATHGILHLLGHDHREPVEREVMFGLQAQLLTEYLGRPAPTPTER